MSQKPISPLLRVWYKWKTLRLPWRRQFLVGSDLSGNTYWEFLERGATLPKAHSHNTPANATTPSTPVRWRRIVQYPSGTHHDSVTVSPAWHQWLRYTRPAPPSLDEQRADVIRQARIKQLAAAADARWDAKPRVMDAPPVEKARFGVREPATLAKTGGGPHVEADKVAAGDVKGGTATSGVSDGEVTVGDRDREAVDEREEAWRRTEEEAEEKKKKRAEAEADPWKQAKKGAGEAWQPTAWEPAARGKK